jgi:hypothetical protein
MLHCKKGVTYSAYGTGEKPKFYGSPEDGANPAYWKLVPGTNNIWEYHTELAEVGFLHVNGNEVLDDKYVAYWDVNQQKYVVSLDLKTPYTHSVLDNLQFFCDVDLKGLTPYDTDRDSYYGQEGDGGGVDLGGQVGNALFFIQENRSGKFYFRCDEGNPGEVYSSIQFVKNTFSKHPFDGKYSGGAIIHIHDPRGGVTVDNLSVMYHAGVAITAAKGVTIQNCEIGFIGGGAIAYFSPDDPPVDQVRTLRDLVLADDGPAITFQGISNVTIANNYFHDIMNGPYNLEHNLDGTFENIKINGNLIERTGYGTNLTQFFSNDDPNIVRYRNVYIDNNYYMYTGYLTDRGLMGKSYPIHQYDFYHPQQFVNVNYTNNIFYISKGTMFHVNSPATLDAFNFSGNTYAHNNYGVLFRDDTREGGHLWLYYDENAEETIKRLTGDKTAIVLPLSFPPTEASPPPNLDTADTWAHGGITEALGKGFVPPAIQDNYKSVITRAEFCILAVRWVEYALDKPIAEVVEERGLPERMSHIFSDTDDPNILAAYRIGITGGEVAPTDTAPGRFNPDGQFNRQQAATMILNTCRAIGADVSNPPAADFTDMNAADSWARPGINFVRANGIMSGTSTANPPTFTPLRTYTRQESIITFNNIRHEELNKD